MEKGDFKVSFEYGLAYCWIAANANAAAPFHFMPKLFLLDRDNRVPHGYWYGWADEKRKSGRVLSAESNARGRGDLLHQGWPHTGLTPQTFLGLGLIKYDEYKAHSEQTNRDGGGGDTGGGGDSSAVAFGAACGFDGGGGGGDGGDGGGCGGGCGGD